MRHVISMFVVQACSVESGSAPELVEDDDGSGMQRWSIMQVPSLSDEYYIVSKGLNGLCGAFLGIRNCSNLSGFGTFGQDDGTEHQVSAHPCASRELLV